MDDNRIQEWHERYEQDYIDYMDATNPEVPEECPLGGSQWRPSELAMELVREVLKEGGWL